MKPTKMKDCPHCLFSSGVVADGKGSTCKVCGGKGKIRITKFNEYIKEYQ